MGKKRLLRGGKGRVREDLREIQRGRKLLVGTERL